MAVMKLHHETIIRDTKPEPEFNEYPKHMMHPAYTPGSVGQEVRGPGGFSYFVGGTPVRFPPVLVKNADDEAWYAAKGYVSQGKSDAAAFARAAQNAPAANTGYVPQQYPKWAGGVLVNDAEEEAEALAARRTQLGLKGTGIDGADEAEAAAQAEAEPPALPAPEMPPAAAERISVLEAQLADMRDMMAKLLQAQPAPAPAEPAPKKSRAPKRKAASETDAPAADEVNS